MKTKLFVLPYMSGSAAAKALSESLGVKRIKQTASKYVPKQNHIIINYGSRNGFATALSNSPARMLNKPEAIANASNKLTAFNALKDACLVPEFTTSKDTAAEWLTDCTVVARTKLVGHSGEGIVIAERGSSPDGLVDAPLYVKYVPKRHEYRVHVCLGQVIDVQRKMRKSDVPDDQVNWKVRNLDGGFIFGREGVELPDEVKDSCIAAVSALSLDFGAVDLIWNEKSNSYYVLEINSAPGLMGTTLANYAEVFNTLLEN